MKMKTSLKFNSKSRRFYSSSRKIASPNKSYLKRFIIGVEHAFQIPSLPDCVLGIHTNIYTRVFVGNKKNLSEGRSLSNKCIKFRANEIRALHFFKGC